MRILAHCSREGICISGSIEAELTEFLRHLEQETCITPITDLAMQLNLFEGASLREVRGDGFELSVDTSQQFVLKVARLGPLEQQQFLIHVHLPRIGEQGSERHLGRSSAYAHSYKREVEQEEMAETSVRLAELELLVNSLPSKLITCQPDYQNCTIGRQSRIVGATISLSIKRTADLLHLCSNPTVLEADLKQHCLSSFRRATTLALRNQYKIAYRVLRLTEEQIQIFLAEFGLAGDLYISLMNHLTVTRLRLYNQQHDTSSQKEHAPLNSNIKATQLYCSTPRELERSLCAESAPPVPPKDQVTPRVTQKATRRRSPKGRIQRAERDIVAMRSIGKRLSRSPTEESNRRASTGSIDVHSLVRPTGTPEREVTRSVSRMNKHDDARPMPFKRPTSLKLHCTLPSSKLDAVGHGWPLRHQSTGPNPPNHIYRTTNEYPSSWPRARTESYVNDQQRLRANEVRDHAQMIWNSHKEERGESAMVSEDEMLCIASDSRRTVAEPATSSSSSNGSFELSPFGTPTVHRVGTFPMQPDLALENEWPEPRPELEKARSANLTDHLETCKIVRFTASVASLDGPNHLFGTASERHISTSTNESGPDDGARSRKISLESGSRYSVPPLVSAPKSRGSTMTNGINQMYANLCVDTDRDDSHTHLRIKSSESNTSEVSLSFTCESNLHVQKPIVN